MVLSRRKARQGEADPGNLITLSAPDSLACEDYRGLRTSLMYSMAGSSPRTVMVTSPGPGEGKTTTCANLGVVLAQAGKSTLVVDCDLRKPMVHKVFSLRNFHGIVSLLVGEEGMGGVMQEGLLVGFSIITSGPLTPNPAELLSSSRFSRFLGEARGQFDYVLIDVPPVESVSDPAVVATHCDGTLLVIDTKSTRKGAVKQSVHTLESVGGRVLGTVMNNVKSDKKGYYYYGYGY